MSLPHVTAAGLTDVGQKRNHNEDSYAIVEDSRLYLVADGMGGHASGEVASKLAIETLKSFFEATEADPEVTWPYKMDKKLGYQENRLITGIKLANLRIHQAAQQELRLGGMGTTLVALLAVKDGIFVGHVGDSRVYMFRDGKLKQLTEDHSLLNDYMKMRQLSDDEIANFPYKNVIVRALGMKDSVKVDVLREEPKVGDRFLLCTDGLCGPVTDAEIAEIMAQGDPIEETCRKLIARANEHGGPDNVTALIAEWRNGFVSSSNEKKD